MPGYSRVMLIHIHMAPLLLDTKSRGKSNTVRDFFTEKTQQSLLQPLRVHLHGFKNVTTGGITSSELGEDVVRDISKD
jgi:hypothetical protein